MKDPRHIGVCMCKHTLMLVRNCDIISSLEISKTATTVSFAFHHYLQILLTLSFHDNVQIRQSECHVSNTNLLIYIPLSITRQPWFDLQLDALNFCLFTYNTFIKLLYIFRALTLLIIRRSTS